MKHCPTCNRTYADDVQKFCLEDGTTLVEESATPFDPQATIALPGSQPTTPTSNPYGSGAGQGSYGSGAGQSSYGAGQGSSGSGAGQSSYGAGQQAPPSWTPTPQPYGAQAAKKRSMLPWVLGGAAVLVVGGIGLIIVIALLVSSSNSNNSNNRANSNSNSNTNANSGKSNSNSTAQSGNVIKSADGTMQITAPSTWKSITGLNEKADLQASSSSPEMYLIVLTENKADFGRRVNLNTYSNITLNTLTKSLTDPNTVGPTNLTINGYPALQYEVSGEISNLNAVYLHTTVETPKHFHQIVAWTSQTTFNQNKDQLQEVIKSFKEN